MKKLLVIPAIAVALFIPSTASASAFKNCTALNAKYPNGVAKSAAAAAAQKKPPKVSATVYKKNIKMDRDKDGTVCEK